MKKQILLFVLALLPLVASADASGTCGNNLTWTYVESTGTLTISGTGAMEDYSYNSPKAPWSSYSIIKVILGDGITSIGDYAFYGCSGLTSVTIPNSVTSIGKFAFGVCSGLTSVTIPNSVTSIGNNAFSGCSGLTSVHITDLEAWCKIVFSNYASNPLLDAHHLFLNGNEVRNLVIPNSVTSLAGTFSGCSSLTSVTIPNSVTSIGGYAFSGCI